MNDIIIGLSGIVAGASPIVIAVIGEILTERSGVLNLSVNGIILISAMAGFWSAQVTDSALVGLATGAGIGMIIGAILAFTSITLKQSQVAIGFILAFLLKDLSYFLGTPLVGESGPTVGISQISKLVSIPVISPIFLNQSWLTYLSFVLIFILNHWLFHSRQGLFLRAAGEQPRSAYARGLRVNVIRYLYTILGSGLVGLAGPMYSLSLKAGWKGTLSGLDGIGWIVLAITIFGGWKPIRGALGAYLFVFFQWIGLVLQPRLTQVPSQVFQVAPFPLMILALLFVNIGKTEWVEKLIASLPKGTRALARNIINFLYTPPPASLGVPFEKE